MFFKSLINKMYTKEIKDSYINSKKQQQQSVKKGTKSCSVNQNKTYFRVYIKS
jgi:hypothetical protein